MMAPTDIIIRASGTLLGGVVLWLLKAGVQAAIQLRDDVKSMKDNHIPHLQSAVEELREAIYVLARKIR